MKFLVFFLLFSISLPALSGPAEMDLQAIKQDLRYSQTLVAAARSVRSKGDQYVLFLGQVQKVLSGTDADDYFVDIPVSAQLSLEMKSIFVGDIVGNLNVSNQSSPLPSVIGLYFKPAAEAP